MRVACLLALLLIAGCGRNQPAEEPTARIHDTTTTADTVAPADTLDRSRNVAPDTAARADTTPPQ